MVNHIYLDHNASTPIDPIVLDAVIQGLQEEGNPSSIHFHGQHSRQKLEKSRETIARYLKVKSHEIIFTSGGTEGANLLLQGLIGDLYSGHIISSNAEHSCVHNVLKHFEKRGGRVSFLPVGLWGAVHSQAVLDAIQPDTRLITLMAVNNETGVKTDIESIAQIAKAANIPFIVDGVALLGKEEFSIPPGVSAMFFSGHKLHAPKGVGFAFCRQSLKLRSLFLGGSQEFNRRAGAENLSGVIGLAKAIELLQGSQARFSEHMRMMRDRLESGLKAHLDGVVINGEGPRVVNTTNISFVDVDGESLLMSLDMEGVSVSHGSACSSGSIEPSRILQGMGVPISLARTAIRFSVSRETTEEEIDRSVSIIIQLVNRIRSLKKTA